MQSKFEIIEEPFIRAILDHISFDTEIMIDLDNTIMEPLIELASDQCFSQWTLLANQVLSDKKTAFLLVLTLYHEVQHHLRMKPVEDMTAFILVMLKNIGIPVKAITARGEALRETTYRQLADIGLDMRGHIIFCDGKDKGICLANYLKSREKLPTHILGVDDKSAHLESEKKVVEALGIRFTGIRYSHLDEKVKQFDIERTHHHLAFLKSRLPLPAQNAIEQLQFAPKDIPVGNSNYHQYFFQNTVTEELSSPASSEQNKVRIRASSF